MDDHDDVLRRALHYPYERASDSFTFVNGACVPYRLDTDVSRLHVVLACGSNAAPEQLRRKFGTHPLPLHVVPVQVHGLDAVYAALMASYGSIPATLAKSAAATVCNLHASLLPDEHLQRMHLTEGGYLYCRLLPNKGVRVLMHGAELSQPVFAYIARGGALHVNGAPVALSEISARARQFEQLSQAQVMHVVRQRVRDALPLEAFIRENVKDGARRRAIARQLRSAPPQLDDCWHVQRDLAPRRA